MAYEIISNIASRYKKYKMKKTIILFAVVLGALSSNAQKNEMINAGIELKGVSPLMVAMSAAQKSDNADELAKKVKKAKTEINKAVALQNEKGTLTKTKDLAKLYYYQGLANLSYMMLAAGDEEIQKEVEADTDKFEEASMGAFRKSIAANSYYEDDIRTMMSQMRGMSLNSAIAMFQEEKYKEAFAGFAGAVEMYDVIGEKDTLAMYNAGLAADNAEMYDEALEYYGKAAELGYGGNALVHQLMVQVINKKNEGKPSEEALKVIQDGKAKYPGNLALSIEEFNYYFSTGDSEKAQASLQEAVKADPKNPILHFNIGATFDEMATKAHEDKKHDDGKLYASKSAEAYKKALELDPKYFDATYNLGALYYNEGVELQKLLDEIIDQKLYEVEAKKAEEKFKEAIAPLEKAHELNGKDTNTIKILKSIFVMIGDDENFAKYNDKLKALEGK